MGGIYATLGSSSGGGGGATSTVLLSKQTASNSATISFNSFVSAAYKTYIVLFRDIEAANNGDTLNMVWSNNNGSSYIATDYSWSIIFANSSGVLTSNAAHGAGSPSFEVFASVSSTNPLNGQVQLFDINSSNIGSYYGQAVLQNSGANSEMDIPNGTLLGATGINALQFACSTGNIASGTFTLLGVIEP